MTSPAAVPQAAQQDRVTAAIVVVLLAGLPLAETEAHVSALLETLGIGAQAASDAVNLIVPQIEPESRTPLYPQPPRIAVAPPSGPGDGLPPLNVVPGEAPTPAQTFTRTTEVPRHSRYLVAAAKRFQLAGSQQEGQAIMRRERTYLAQHLNAVRAARDAARRVDQAVARHGTTLGWHAHLDSRTTPECRAANGANFQAAKPPLIGFPGTLHGGTCRCLAGPAHDTTLTVDEATAALRQNAVIPFAHDFSVAAVL